jgi:hypothetical protein
MKTSVYSWRVTSERKALLEELARKQKRSVSEVLDEAVTAWIEQRAANDDDEDAQSAMRRSAHRAMGRIRGGDADRASNARALVRERLQRTRATE